MPCWGAAPGVHASGSPRLQPLSLRSLMEPEKEKTGRQPKKGRKRRRAPNKLVGAAEAMRAGWEFEERHPEVKVSSGGRPDRRPGRPGSLRSGPENGSDDASPAQRRADTGGFGLV